MPAVAQPGVVPGLVIEDEFVAVSDGLVDDGQKLRQLLHLHVLELCRGRRGDVGVQANSVAFLDEPRPGRQAADAFPGGFVFGQVTVLLVQV